MTKKELEIAKENYYANYNQFMMMWANDIREWTECKDAVFYKDGVFDIDEWFDNENFRPLFILKEPHEKNEVEAKKEVEKHSELETIKNCINFVGINGYGSDPWGGTGMWGRIGILAEAMFRMNTMDIDKEQIDTKAYYDILKSEKNNKKEGETMHERISKKTAIINLKKIGGGNNSGSHKSRSTICFECHAEHFYNKLIEQIDIINPTIIICCGKGVIAKCIGAKNGYLEISNNKNLRRIPVINAYHPQQTSTNNFYCATLKEIKNRNLFNSNK